MQDKIIARRHNSYRLRAGTVTHVDPGKGPLMQAGIGQATMEQVSVDWDDGAPGTLTRRFPVDMLPDHRLYSLFVESGVSVHPDRPVFLFNSSNGNQHREVNAPSVRSKAQLVGDRLPIVLAAIVAVAFIMVYQTYEGSIYRNIVMGMGVLTAVLVAAWVLLTLGDVRSNRRRAERLEDELSAAREAVEAINADISSRLAAESVAVDQPTGEDVES